MDLMTWFDIHNPAHLQAYRHLQQTGQWPADFLPADIVLSNFWQFGLMARLADAFLAEHLPPEQV